MKLHILRIACLLGIIFAYSLSCSKTTKETTKTSTGEEVEKIISRGDGKTCEVDPVCAYNYFHDCCDQRDNCKWSENQGGRCVAKDCLNTSYCPSKDTMDCCKQDSNCTWLHGQCLVAVCPEKKYLPLCSKRGTQVCCEESPTCGWISSHNKCASVE